ncbi:MAG: nucleotidyltransferase domain-containing protein [Bacteroidales bacterium]|nr:nucleotidyltransferase domain-containing protein [Bacteroidales bacterium]MCF8402582.1 nucleotidyltransferase domain-containing protein [Bacteroidales bacterium]
MNYGLSDKSFSMIINGLAQFDDIQEGYLYGSRAMGNFKKGSDVDIAIKGENISYHIVVKLSALLNEDLPLPYFFDITHYENCQNKELKDHIDNVGIKIYSKSKEIVK